MTTVARETGWYQMSKVINPNEHVLIVEDDDRIRRLLARYLTKSGLSVDGCADKRGLDQKLQARTPDCILLDLRLPDANGLDIARDLRETYPGIGIIILTGASDSVDKIVGLEIGADDYITKPFEEREILARIRTVLRRLKFTEKSSADPESIQIDDLEIDFSRHRVSKHGLTIDLTGLEFTLLSLLVKAKNRPLTRDALLENLSGRDWLPNDRSVDVLVGKLRKKIESDPAKPQLIKTMRGMGYVFAGTF